MAMSVLVCVTALPYLFVFSFMTILSYCNVKSLLSKTSFGKKNAE